MSETQTTPGPGFLQKVARYLDLAFNGPDLSRAKANGFVLLAFPIGTEEGRRVNYVSNCERADMLVALKEIVARFEGRVQETDTRQ